MVLLITLGVAVLLLAGLLIWNWYSGKQQAAGREEAALVHVTTVEDPVQLTYCNGKTPWPLRKEGDDWKSKDTPSGLPAGQHVPGDHRHRPGRPDPPTGS